MLLVDEDGRIGTGCPAQMVIDDGKENVGVIFWSMFTESVKGKAHPVEGMKVYVPEVLLSTTEGFHVPLIPLFDVKGSEGTAFPEQMLSDGPKLNAGVTIGLTVTLNVVDVAHWFASGVNT